MTKTVTYIYDAFNRWIGETVDRAGQAVQQTRFVYDGNQIVLQFDKTGTGNLAATDLSHRYLWGPAVDQLLADEQLCPLSAGEGQGEGSTCARHVVWPLTDNQGTVRDLAVYNSGNDTTVANHRVYNAYGELEEPDELGGGLPVRLHRPPVRQGHRRAEQWRPLVRGGHRPLAERRPVGFAAGDPNLSRYVGNSPLTPPTPRAWLTATGSPYNNGNGCVGCQGYALMSAGPDGQGGDAEDIDGGSEPPRAM